MFGLLTAAPDSASARLGQQVHSIALRRTNSLAPVRLASIRYASAMAAELPVVDAREEHLPAIAEIYATAALTTPATFDFEGRPVAWWRAVLEAVDPAAGDLLLVAVDP